jgi:O-antigen ligase
MDLFFILFWASVAAYFVFAVKKNSAAVIALPLLFPLYLLSENVFGVPFTLVEAIIYVTFFAWLLVFMFAGCRGLRGVRCLFGACDGARNGRAEKFAAVRSFFKSPLILPILFIIVGAVIAVIVSKQNVLMLDGTTVFYGGKVALGILKGWIVCPLIMFFLFFVTVKKNESLLKMLDYYTVSAVVLSLWSLFQVITQSYVTVDARASGPFISANYLALYIAPAVLYLLIRIRESFFYFSHIKNKKAPLEHPEHLLFVFGFLVIAFALFFTKSYAALTAVILSAIFYFGFEYFGYRKQKGLSGFPWKIVAISVPIVVTVVVAVFIIDPSKLGAVLQFQARNSSSVRVEVYTIATNLLKENWVTGIGLGQFPAYYQLDAVRILGHVPYEWNMLHPHNLYLAFWLNLGLLGFVAFVRLIYMMFARCKSDFMSFAFGKIAESAKIKMVGLALMLIILFHGILDTPFFKNDLALLFWLIAAVIFLPNHERVSHTRSEAKCASK